MSHTSTSGDTVAALGMSTSATPTGSELAKQAMRARIRAERHRRPASCREANALATSKLIRELPEVATAGCVAAYASTRTEPDTAPLRQALRAAGVRVLLPVVLPDGELDWAEDDGNLHQVAKVGGPQPLGPRLGLDAIRQADVVLVPALAVDTLGNRLGQGAGYYDRALRLIEPHTPVIALVHESEVLDAAVAPIPAQAHDIPMDAVVTSHRCLRLPRRRRP